MYRLLQLHKNTNRLQKGSCITRRYIHAHTFTKTNPPHTTLTSVAPSARICLQPRPSRPCRTAWPNCSSHCTQCAPAPRRRPEERPRRLASRGDVRRRRWPSLLEGGVGGEVFGGVGLRVCVKVVVSLSSVLWACWR